MATITINDTVWATATFEGRTIASFTSSGFTSLADVLKAVRKALGKAQCAKCKPGLAAGTQSVYCTYAPGCTVVAVLTFFCEFVLIIFLLIVFFVLLHFIYCLVF